MDKHAMLLTLANQRKKSRWDGYYCLGDYHGGAYECDFVSPYTRTAGNVDSEILIMLQDWTSDRSLRGPVGKDRVTFGYTPSLPTNRNLENLLSTTFQKSLKDVYATNLFPFIKPKGMSEPIPQSDLVKAAQVFALPQIRIVCPRLIICLGLVTFNALREASGMALSSDLSSAIDSPFNFCDARVWCQAHTGHWGQINRKRVGAGQVSKDWQRMKADLEARRNGPIGEVS
jgi:hypothetical protein